jgi:RND family efflux transporter MFP subunit
MLLIGWRVAKNAPIDRPKGSPPVPVSIAFVEQRDVPQLASGIGTVQPLSSVVLRPQVSGIITEVLFVEGQTVTRGQLLARLDDRSIAANLRQAQAEQARNEAQLKAAKLDQARYDNLLVLRAVSQQAVEQQTALVEQLNAAIAAGQATVAAQKVQISYTRITSPISGRVGLRHIDPGNLVQVGDPRGLVSVTQVDPISVVFSLPQQLLPTVQPLMRGEARALVEAYDREGGVLLGEGKLTTLDNQVDPASGTVLLRAEFNNKEGALWPGQFVTVRVRVGVSTNALVVPVQAVKRGPQGSFVYRVREGRAEVVPVHIGPAHSVYSNENVVVIQDGLAKGERVVIDGHSRLTPDALVKWVEPARSVGP